MSQDAKELQQVIDGAVPEVTPGAVALVSIGGTVVSQAVGGELARFADTRETLLDEREPVTLDTVYDLASLTKLYVTVLALSLVDEGALALDEPVERWLPEYGDSAWVTLRQLLTHTSGLPDVYAPRGVDGPSRWRSVMSVGLLDAPGTVHRYSCVGFQVAGRIVESAGGAGLDALLAERIAEPLGLKSTGFLPADPSRCAATEIDERGTCRGIVHDEASYALGGVAGNAGVFATAPEVLRFAEALRTGELLSPASAELMTTPQTTVPVDGGWRQALGARIGDPAMCGPLTDAYGHTGFTGTSLLVDPSREATAVLLTNRVHPSRTRSTVNPVRCAVAQVTDTIWRTQRNGA
ncbi:serine hydrolase domain-containing protein [Phytomonospora sp. NPDC050363]|uniref:serine hydrolase domain-containing protein n=1 Tax=Phytomonospora sp. NPDC050363 TaxID=3155642 RepID=UPI0033F20419